MNTAILKTENLKAQAGDREILHDINLSIGPGETHVIMGPNGAGKSTLVSLIMGDPAYAVNEGKVIFQGEDITDLPVNERAAKGLFMSFQNPIEVPGISLFNFIRTALEMRGGEKIKIWEYRKEVTRVLKELRMDPEFAERDLNVGFSGGEKKKAEVLQMLLLKPSLAILDETDSGLDVDAVHTVSQGIRTFQQDKDASLLIITHNAAILSSLKVDAVHILVDGKIIKEGGSELIKQIEEEGFAAFTEEA
ncbi:MAG: Fe-S cluster assembly ATPase SufC [Lachnospiraceae bacterium]|nr:Fe-S cluster assembly ATPase SufC [Lachnospiraceae bacterium]